MTIKKGVFGIWQMYILYSASATCYDPSLSLELVHYTADSYCNDRVALANWTCKDCLSPPLLNVTVVWNSSSQIQGFVGSTGSSIVVAFRGSVGALDWLEDFDFSLIPLPNCDGCLVAHGFYRDCFLSVWNQVQEALEVLGARRGLPIFLTGHSLGAAIIELTAWHMAQGSYNLSAVYTYGTPRVGNPSWAAAFASALPGIPAFRVTHFRDPVPHLPLEFQGYFHPPTEVWYSTESGSEWRQCSGKIGEDSNCSDSILPLNPDDHNTYLGFPIDDCNS